MALIDCDEHGLFRVEIADADGELRSYRITPGLTNERVWNVTLARCDAEEEYHVGRDARGQWMCGCKAFEYRKRRDAVCKHIAFARGLRVFLRAMSPQPQGVRP